ncbi:MAG: patatin-like phospholipase family protein [Planctomycetes bacterium]|nr:patatin-like phospholipase family protein [Planctomycetota bacterium]
MGLKFRMLCAACTVLVLGGCSTPRTMSEEKLRELEKQDALAFRAEFDAAVARLMDRIARRMDEAGGKQVTLDLLALSGGGDYGAFGAGLLVGWAKAPGDFKRPDFDCVTGVSTGSMLAPFAYVGTDESCRTVEEFYRNPRSDWVQMHWPFFFWPSNPSFATIPGLHRDLVKVMDKQFAEEMAAQSEKGKLLLVSASNIDLSKQRFWDLGPLAAAGVKDGDLSPVSNRMLASAAIPVVFPPVKVGDFLYVDGGVTANVLLRLDPKSPDGFIQTWRRRYPDRPIPNVRYWIVINNQIHPAPQVVSERWPSIVSPALEMSIRSGTLAEVRWLAAEAMYVNAEFDANIEVRVIAIPDDWRPPVPGDFQRETMDSLAELGEKMGADPSAWSVWCSRAMSNSRDAWRPVEGPTGIPRSTTPGGPTPPATPSK